MSLAKYFDQLVYNLFRNLFAVEENHSFELGKVKKILIIRQHNQFGDLLASVSIFRAFKEKYPECHVTLIVSPANYYAVTKNKYIDKVFLFDKKKLTSISYIKELNRLLKDHYDVAVVPSNVSISFTSNILARLANAKVRIGVSELNGMENKSSFLFDRRIKMDWRKYPDANVSDFCLDIVRPFGISTNDFSSNISFDATDIEAANIFIKSVKTVPSNLLIGLHVGAGKPANRWSLKKYVELIRKLNNNFSANFYLTGSNADIDEIDYVKRNLDLNIGICMNKKIPELAAVISLSDLFITNDTGVMHVAGATKTPQVSIFGPTNPFNWAPIGLYKCFVRKSDLIDDVTVDDVYTFCENILNHRKTEIEDSK